MKPYKCKEFNKYGIVRLPCKWRRQFDFTPGKLVDLVYKKESIIVKKHNPKSTDNSRIVSGEGTISIPAELKRLLSLTPDDEICIYIDKDNECFILKPL
ncbi:AbrB/MazE/SpoVT family DNA-binding domain-containing protein [Mesobacillus sp.]|uniref:AbrB/MazE/SpoVT family DNA-binding domain-containing protein n=1 Tax=Mesobacillus sp. TaxID=2675271 RepID=UPI0039EF7EFC